MASRLALAFVCIFGATAWPWAVRAFADMLMSPFDRALQTAWCGAHFNSGAALFGHCAACWTGSTLLAATGIFLLQRDLQSAVTRQAVG